MVTLKPPVLLQKSLIYETPFSVIMYGSYKLLKIVYFGPLCVLLLL